MTTRKLVAGLNQQIQGDLRKKFKLSFNEEKLNKDLVEKLKLIFGSSSTKRAIEQAFNTLAVLELSHQDSIHSFPAYDYIQKLNSLESDLEDKNTVYVSTWAVIATSNLVKNKYKKLEFNSVEDVINLIVSSIATKTNCLWSSSL